jgi:hypothetical protein
LDRWVDEDEDGSDLDLRGIDFSNFGGTEAQRMILKKVKMKNK